MILQSVRDNIGGWHFSCCIYILSTHLKDYWYFHSFCFDIKCFYHSYFFYLVLMSQLWYMDLTMVLLSITSLVVTSYMLVNWCVLHDSLASCECCTCAVLFLSVMVNSIVNRNAHISWSTNYWIDSVLFCMWDLLNSCCSVMDQTFTIPSRLNCSVVTPQNCFVSLSLGA